jgi:hypothetical protein
MAHSTPSRILKRCTFVIAVVGMSSLSVSTVQAQLMDQLKGAVGSGQTGGALGGLGGGGGLPAVGQASPSNTAGVLQYCVRNNYVNGNAASSVKNSLLSKVTGGGQTSNDSGFKAGNSGILQTGKGQDFSLGGDGIKAQVTHKVCDEVLQHAKSLL